MKGFYSFQPENVYLDISIFQLKSQNKNAPIFHPMGSNVMDTNWKEKEKKTKGRNERQRMDIGTGPEIDIEQASMEICSDGFLCWPERRRLRK